MQPTLRPTLRQSKPLDLSFGWTWFPKTWTLFSKAPWPIFGFALLGGFITLAISIVPVLGKVVSGFFYPLLLGGGIRVLSTIDSGRAVDMADFFAPLTDRALFRRYLPMCLTCGALMLGTAIISGVLIVSLGLGGLASQGTSMPSLPGGLPGGLPGTVMLTLVGTLVTLVMSLVMAILCLYGPALVDLEGASSKEGMEQSLVLTSRNWLPFLVLGFVYLLPALVFLLPGGLLALASVAGAMPWLLTFVVSGLGALMTFVFMLPISFCMPYIIYKESFPSTEPTAAPSPVLNQPPL